MELPDPYVATLQDEPLFKCLCMKLMEHEAELGGLVIPNDYNLGIHLRTFRAYATGTVPGYTLFIGNFAMVMHGGVMGGWQLKPGNCAYLHLIYIEPEYRGKGLSHKFHQFAMKRLPELGFDFTMFQSLVGNEMPVRAMKGAVDGKLGAGKGKVVSVTRWWPLRGD